jgi:hypothetical protein
MTLQPTIPELRQSLGSKRDQGQVRDVVPTKALDTLLYSLC